MMKINWQQKLSSRKFWSLIAAFATSLMVLFGAGEDEITKVFGLVGAVGSVAIYTLGESYVDAKREE